ncbi:MAG: hypothetical protein HKN95_04950 [Acidimicrobiia bacterium]|jgi:DNA-directed RNA polymerase subunit RPC12/RpoP|nr:hypothetical protein [Acidimicrobiia bacterium]
MQPASIITCVECGGRAHLISFAPPDRGYEPGDQLVYRCEDCMDRFDVINDDIEPPEETLFG